MKKSKAREPFPLPPPPPPPPAVGAHPGPERLVGGYDAGPLHVIPPKRPRRAL